MRALEHLCRIGKQDADVIINMDETPSWFDLIYEKIVGEVGAKSVDVVTTGSYKKRFTVIASIAASLLCPLASFSKDS